MTDIQSNTEATEQLGTSSKPLRALARFVSWIFHPVFMPPVMAYVLFMLSRDIAFAGIPDKTFNLWLIQIALNTTGYSLLAVAIMKKLDFIKSIYMTDHNDRIISLIVIMIFYFWNNYIIGNQPDVPVILHTLTLGCFWGIIVVFMVGIFFKVSLHAAGAGGMLGILLVLMFTSPVNMVLPFFIALAIAGIIGTARMLLGAHKIWEVWLGYILGILVQVAAYFYLS